MMKFQKKIAEQSEYYTRLKEEILNSYQDMHIVPLWIRDYFFDAVLSAIQYRQNLGDITIKCNRLTINIMLPLSQSFEDINAIYGYRVKYDSSIPDGEIDINGFRHQVWPRNLKFLDLLKLGD